MTLSPEQQKELIEIYLKTGNISETAKRMNVSRTTVIKYVNGAEAVIESRQVKTLSETTVEEARSTALEDLNPAIAALHEVLENPLNQIVHIKAAEVLAKVAKVKAELTGELAPKKIDSVQKVINLTDKFREFMEIDKNDCV